MLTIFGNYFRKIKCRLRLCKTIDCFYILYTFTLKLPPMSKKPSSIKNSSLPQSMPQRRMGPHTLLTMVWKVLFYSLLLDAILLLRAGPVFSSDITTELSTLCALAVLPFLNQFRIAQSLARLRDLQQAKKHLLTGATKLIIIVFCFVLVMLKLQRIDYFASIKGVIFSLFIVCWGALLIYSKIKNHRLAHHDSDDDSWLQILAWERQSVFLNIVPLFLARGVSFIPSLSSSVTDISWGTYIQTISSALLLLMLRPKREHYLGHCSTCLSVVPIAFVQYGKCPFCDNTLSKNVANRDSKQRIS